MRPLTIPFAITTLIILLYACRGKEKGPIDGATVLHQNEDQLTNVIIYDVFTPPVASR
ncbi:MAG: vanadium-dependent haloperoxidase, partial [Mucilaginibacter sp.]|nr:vanadium-dependent haloperoxidase [Mucilaginibacter sp.]